MNCDIHKELMIDYCGQEICLSCLADSSLEALNKNILFNANQKKILLAKNFKSTGIPLRFKEATFDSFVPTTERSEKLRDVLYSYVVEFEVQRTLRTGFIFLGGSGRGKTHLACAMAAYLMTLYSVKYVSLPDLTARIKSSFSNHRVENSQDIISELIGVDFLILDEIDLHGSSDTEYQILYNIINGRYEAGNKPIVAISNRDIQKLTIDLDDRIISRILCGSPAITFNWESVRDQQAQISKNKILNLRD